MAVEIQELDDLGEYQPVEVQVKPDIYCGGVYQLRQVSGGSSETGHPLRRSLPT